MFGENQVRCWLSGCLKALTWRTCVLKAAAFEKRAWWPTGKLQRRQSASCTFHSKSGKCSCQAQDFRIVPGNAASLPPSGMTCVLVIAKPQGANVAQCCSTFVQRHDLQACAVDAKRTGPNTIDIGLQHCKMTSSLLRRGKTGNAVISYHSIARLLLITLVGCRGL